MSQFYQGVTEGSLPPSVPTSFVTDAGTAIPIANILNVLTSDAATNNDNGIADTGTGNTVTIQLTNRLTGTITTADDTTTTVIAFGMGATPGTFYVSGNVQAFAGSIPASASFSFTGGYRTDGVTAVELGTEYHDPFQDVSLITTDITLSTVGNNILLNVIGVAATSINWNSLLEYRQVN